jgi:vacuolar-type H+-ATPase subunit E/Vma4
VARASIVTEAQISNFAEIVDELARTNYGHTLAVAVLVDSAGGVRVASAIPKAELANTLRALLARIESELAESAS